ncbi:MAG: hypothetical protein JOY59_05075, partial [Candidatus Eremiobacteraeota bacterium]|nr:hypothetical protein [Candidatus Eremiobacteraeota bacterium]
DAELAAARDEAARARDRVAELERLLGQGDLGQALKVAEARAHAAEVIEFVGLARRREVLGKSLTIADKKRLEVGRALATDPALLLLDEVMAGLTPAEARSAVDLLRAILARGITILMVEHVMEVLMPIADHVVVVSAGKTIFAGSAADAANDAAVVEAYLGPPVTDRS